MDFVILALIMLAIGIYGLLTNRQLLKVFISIELIATAATLNFVMLASPHGLGEALLILAFSVDTAVSAVILALLVLVSKRYGTGDLSKIIAEMQENAEKEESEVEAQ
ncbi:MAG: NADH-quinone oxidoreductase subunit K [Candidatus Bathyarchaeota archaeon]|nr:NADH-quinone oxidoreductase subunit K [Candidatus Bathyarchaeota archaeon]